MSADIDLKEIEQKTWQAFFKDGLVDMVMGIFLLTPGIRILTDNVWCTFGFLVAVLVMVGGKLVTAQRIGRVRFGTKRRQRLFKGYVVFTIVLLAVLAVWVIVLGWVDTSAGIRAAILGIGIMSIYSAVAYWIDIRRWYIYGALLGTGFIFLELDYEPAGPIAFIVAGCIVLALGLGTFIRFLRKYPNPE
ncbi:MAG: hypothetical protein SVM79_05555, partial [Chloroflexota bacterium]|nr:hypothetical protein [Chloroflexota bacterium]